MCSVRWLDAVKTLPHVEHSYGRSPVCTHMCVARVLACEKALPHVSQP
jgi:hypothetical protein